MTIRELQHTSENFGKGTRVAIWENMDDYYKRDAETVYTMPYAALPAGMKDMEIISFKFEAFNTIAILI